MTGKEAVKAVGLEVAKEVIWPALKKDQGQETINKRLKT
jgi:hypothetical protein